MKERVCECCGKTFMPKKGNNIYCSKQCRIDFCNKRNFDNYHNNVNGRKEKQKEYARIRYGGMVQVPGEHFENWVERYDKADNLTRLSMLSRVCGIHYGHLVCIKDTDPQRFLQIEAECLREKQEEMAERKKLIEEREKERKLRDAKKNAWKNDVVPMEKRTGQERCRECKYLNTKKRNDSYAFKCESPSALAKEKEVYKYKTAKVCIKCFTLR